jgi:hypothetical protein
MKIATVPPIPVAPDFMLTVEGVLAQGESGSKTVGSAVRKMVLTRMHQAEFVRRGIAAIGQTKRKSDGIGSQAVVAKLEARLAAARRSQS